MVQVKVVLASAAIFFTLAALSLIWFDTEFVFGMTAAKVYSSLLVILAVVMTKECCLITEEDEQEIC